MRALYANVEMSGFVCGQGKGDGAASTYVYGTQQLQNVMKYDNNEMRWHFKFVRR